MFQRDLSRLPSKLLSTSQINHKNPLNITMDNFDWMFIFHSEAKKIEFITEKINGATN